MSFAQSGDSPARAGIVVTRGGRWRRFAVIAGIAVCLALGGAAIALALTGGEGTGAAERRTERCARLIEAGDLTAALEICSEAIELDPEVALPLAYRALIYVRLGRYQLALEDAEKALRLDSDLAIVHNARAQARLGLGQHREAAADAREALRLDADLADASLALAHAYRALGRVEDAAREAARACDLGLSAACEFSPVPTRDEAIEILPAISLTRSDLPAEMFLVDSALYSLEEEALRGFPGYRRQLQSWGFVLGHERLFASDAPDSLLDVFVVVWLHESAEHSEEAFVDGAFFSEGTGSPGEAEFLDDFPTLGDESEAFWVTAPYPLPFQGEAIESESYIVVIRRGPLLALLSATYRRGEASFAEFLDLAQTIAVRMEGEPLE